MKDKVKDILLGTLVVAMIVALGLFVLSTKKPIESAVVKYDSLEASKPFVVMGKKGPAIGPVTIYELTTPEGKRIYVSISNAAGVTSSVTVAD